ncbi:hypothetical protein HYR99_37625, partial [Candidatus Poribacteria bacterium]|nr:hypothetical protein [Candidatus Poribacteria bacterium]
LNPAPASPTQPAGAVNCDGADATYEIHNEFGRDWAYVIVPAGSHRMEFWQ